MTVRPLPPSAVTNATNQLAQQAKAFAPGTYTFTVQVTDPIQAIGGRSIVTVIAASPGAAKLSSMN
jgi:hypothetical protein